MSGFYINLDRSTDRRAHMERELAAYGLSEKFTRVPAIDGRAAAPGASTLKPGEIGCYLSHLRALEAGRAEGGPVHILEDDVILSEVIAPFADAMEATGQFEKFDIIFTDTAVQPDLMLIRFYKQAFEKAVNTQAGGVADFRLIDMSRQPFVCASSYIVSPHAIRKVSEALKAASADGPVMPVDLLYRALANQGHLRVGCVFPFLTTVRLEDIARTTIEDRPDHVGNPSVMAIALLRYAFFVKADLPGYARPFIEALPGPPILPSGDPRQDVIMKIVQFVLSDAFQSF